MKTRESELFFKSLFLDLAILNLILFLNVWINPIITFSDNLIVNKHLLFFNLSWVLTQFVFFRRTFYLEKRFIYRILRISYQTFVFISVSALSLFIITPETLEKTFFLSYWISFYLTELFVYLIFFNYMKNRSENEFKLNRVLIIGFNDTGQFFQRLIVSNPILGYKFVGFVNEELSTNPCVLGHPDKLDFLIKKHKIQTIFVVQSNFQQGEMQDFLDICDSFGVRLWMVSDNYDVSKRAMKKKTIDGLILVNPKEIPLDFFNARFFKRFFDIIFSLFVIIFILSWLFPILAVLIKLSSKGPIFFIQKRTGFNNSVFDCYKFRTMYINDKADVLQATANDDRVTKIGQFLRKTNIDEFPQFINVLLGQMSVVGPRPHMLKHTEEYSTLITGYLTRHFVKPGITGWAQVNGLHGETDALWKMEKRVEYDIHYMNNWTFWLDIKIVPMTVFNKRRYLRFLDMKGTIHKNQPILEGSDDFLDFRQSE